MKKIFSLALMATALLISGQVKAADVAQIGTTKYTSINAAFAAATDGQTITLLANANQDKPIVINDGRKLTLDLAGYTLTLPDAKGQSLKAKSVAYKSTPDNSALYTDTVMAYFCSNFNIQNAQLVVKTSKDGGKVINATVPDDAYVTKTGVYDRKNEKNSQGNAIRGFFVIGSNVNVDYGFTKLTIEEGVSVSSNGKDAVEVYYSEDRVKRLENPKGNYARYSYGVEVIIKGSCYGKMYGVQVSGTVQQGDADTNMPKMTIAPTAEVSCLTDCNGSTAIYAAGYAIWDIQGYVHGSTGVYAKSGQIDITNASIEGTGASHENISKTGSGVSGGQGSALIVESNEIYSGQHNVTISGDSKITANAGCAIEEIVLTSTTESLVTAIDIKGGSFEVNNDSTAVMSFTNATTSTPNTVKIEGGTLIPGEDGNAKVTIGGSADEKLGQVTSGTSYVTEVVTENGTAFVVTTGTTPDACANINDADDDANIILAAGTQTLNDDKVLGNLTITNGTTLTIAAGKTLTVANLIMGNDDKIIVPATSALIATGNDGIYAVSASNIVLQAEGDQIATLIFKYSVGQNKQPWATIYYNSSCKQVGATSRTWNRMATPFTTLSDYATANKDTVTIYPGQTWGTAFQYWDPATGWQSCELDEWYNPILAPFAGIALANRSKYGTAVYKFEGQLQGVKEGTLRIKKGWNYFGNSFTANMDLVALLEQLPSNIAGLKLWDAEHQKFEDVNKDLILDGMSDYEFIPAMQTFMFKASEACDVILDYKKLIWDYNVQ